MLGLLAQRSQQALVPDARAVLAVERAGSGYVVRDGGDVLTTVESPRAVLDAVFARVHRRAFELAARKGWVRVHGTVVRLAGARLAVVGPAGAGKTTLALGVLATGGVAEGDESFLVRDGEVVAVPRRFHVKPGSEQVVPEAASWLAAAPVLDGEPPLRLLDPTEVGRPWDLPVGPIDHLVLVARGEATSACTPASAAAAAPEVLAQAFPTVEDRGTIVRAVSSLLRGAGVHRLVTGSDGRAVALLEDVARAPRDR